MQGRIDQLIAPFAVAVTRLNEIPGVGVTIAQVIIAEVGLEVFETPAHLTSWVSSAPGVSESAGRKKAARHRAWQRCGADLDPDAPAGARNDHRTVPL